MDFNSSLKHFLLSLSTNPSVLRANTLFSAKENCRKDSKRKFSSLKYSLNLSLVSARSQHLVGTLVFSHLAFCLRSRLRQRSFVLSRSVFSRVCFLLLVCLVVSVKLRWSFPFVRGVCLCLWGGPFSKACR